MSQEPSIYRLAADVRSAVKSHVLYGRVGDEVKIIADHIEVLICENECGRFPVLKSLVTTDQVELTEQVAFIPQKAPTKKASKKPLPITAVTLF